MPLDGLSFSNAGLFRITTPAEVALQAEHLAQNKAEAVIKEVDKGESVKTEIEEKEDQESGYSGRDNRNDSESKEEKDFLDKKEDIKKYKVKFNQLTDMVELVDQVTGIVIETISPNDLVGIISKSKNASGILVDREI